MEGAEEIEGGGQHFKGPPMAVGNALTPAQQHRPGGPGSHPSRGVVGTGGEGLGVVCEVRQPLVHPSQLKHPGATSPVALKEVFILRCNIKEPLNTWI